MFFLATCGNTFAQPTPTNIIHWPPNYIAPTNVWHEDAYTITNEPLSVTQIVCDADSGIVGMVGSNLVCGSELVASVPSRQGPFKEIIEQDYIELVFYPEVEWSTDLMTWVPAFGAPFSIEFPKSDRGFYRLPP
jgi:hypothetical protein